MADAEAAPAEPQGLTVLYCGGMFIAVHIAVSFPSIQAPHHPQLT